MYNCKRCGHALPSNSTLCPNCGAMMDSRQLEIRKALNKNNNSYIDNIVNSCDVSKGIPSYQGLSEEQGISLKRSLKR